MFYFQNKVVYQAEDRPADICLKLTSTWWRWKLKVFNFSFSWRRVKIKNMRESWPNRYRSHEKNFFYPRPRPSTCYPRPSNQFALCFRVLSNLYVERSAYANVFKFNREKKHFDRAKVNSRCFHWFPAVMFILNTIIFSDILCQITWVPSIVHPQNVCTLFIYYSSTIFEFPDLIYWMVSDFIFHLRDNQAYLRDAKTANTWLLKLFCLN